MNILNTVVITKFFTHFFYNPINICILWRTVKEKVQRRIISSQQFYLSISNLKNIPLRNLTNKNRYYCNDCNSKIIGFSSILSFLIKALENNRIPISAYPQTAKTFRISPFLLKN